MGFNVNSDGTIKPVFKQNTSFDLTGVTLKSVMYNALIQAGTLKENDILTIISHFTCTSNANVKQIEVYFNTTPDLAGTPILIGVRTLTSMAGSSFIRSIVFKNSLTSQGIITNLLQYANDENVTQNQILINANFNVNQYIVVAGQLANASDLITLNNITSQINR
jgi:hypothetical protein